MTEMETKPVSALVKIVEGAGLPVAKAAALLDSFGPLVEEAGTLVAKSETIRVTDATQVSEMKQAREVRLALKRVRVSAEGARKELKADILAAGKAIDGANRWLLDRIEPAEARMEEAEKFAEKAESRRRADQKAQRTAILAPFGVDVSFYDLGAMPDATFAQLLDSTRLAHEQRLSAAKKAEEERIAAVEARRIEDERIRADNARLAEENAKIAEAARIAERRAKQEREAAEAKARAEREEMEKQARAEREAAESELRKANAAREAAERKVREEREAAERKAKAEEAARKKAERAPDCDKLKALAAAVRGLQIPTCATPEGQAACQNAAMAIEHLAKTIESLARNL